MWLRLALGVLATAATLSAQAPDRSRAEALARRASERLHALYEEADRLATESRTLIGDLRKLEVERQIRAEQLLGVDAELKTVTAELGTLDSRIQQLEQEDRSEAPELRARLAELYKLGRARYLRLLLSTSDVRQLAQASRMVAALAKIDRDRLATFQRRLEALKTSRGELQERRARVGRLRSEADAARLAADRAVQARNALLQQIDERRDLNAQLSGELQAAQQKLQSTLKDVGATPGTAPLIDLPVRPFRGDLDWPVSGAVRQRFGTMSARGVRFNGLEITSAEGSPVHAVHGGTVAFADRFTGLGTLVIVDHGAQVFSLYGNLLETSVKAGGTLERGHSVGLSGASATGAPGVYFELRVDGRPVDPLQWLKKP